MKECCACKDAERHTDDRDDVIKLVTIKDPDDGKLVRRGYFCSEHIEIYENDGYCVY